MTLIANRKGRTVDLSDSEKRIQEAMLRAWNTPAIRKDWTQTKLADKLGIPQPVISQYLNGKIPPNLKTVLRFCSELGLDPITIAPDWENYFAVAKLSGKLYKIADLQKDGTTVIFKDPVEIEGWMSPVPSARAIYAERFMSDKCPAGTILMYDEAKQYNKDKVLGNKQLTYVIDDERKTPRRLWVCEVEGRELVNIETRESVLTLTGADDNVEFPARVKVHPLIGKMCLTGIV